jgi:YjbE family integral membrane protein
MEFISAEFFSALLAIILIDLVLAGDNAIVIALAARNLPEAMRKRAIFWGAIGAVVVRSVMTLGVVWLLGIPGLLALGGTLLLWIAYKLLISQDGGDEKKVVGAMSFAAAMKTIIVADAVMGIDNVLAVAGAAHGSYLLVVIGLLISIPIVIGGSTLILKFTERFPSIVYFGAGVLAWTSVKMILSEPIIAQALAGQTALSVAIYVVVIAAVLLAGLLRNYFKQIRLAVRAYSAARRASRVSQLNASQQRGVEMNKVLIPVDGSTHALAAVHAAIEEHRRNPKLEVALLHVRPTFHRHIARYVSRSNIESYQTEQAEKAIAPSKMLLERWGVPYQSFVDQGPRSETIAQFAETHKVSRILVGVARKNSLTRLAQSSVTAKLLEKVKVPVQIIVGGQASRLERFGVPVGLGAALAAAVLAD